MAAIFPLNASSKYALREYDPKERDYGNDGIQYCINPTTGTIMQALYSKLRMRQEKANLVGNQLETAGWVLDQSGSPIIGSVADREEDYITPRLYKELLDDGLALLFTSNAGSLDDEVFTKVESQMVLVDGREDTCRRFVDMVADDFCSFKFDPTYVAGSTAVIADYNFMPTELMFTGIFDPSENGKIGIWKVVGIEADDSEVELCPATSLLYDSDYRAVLPLANVTPTMKEFKAVLTDPDSADSMVTGVTLKGNFGTRKRLMIPSLDPEDDKQYVLSYDRDGVVSWKTDTKYQHRILVVAETALDTSTISIDMNVDYGVTTAGTAIGVTHSGATIPPSPLLSASSDTLSDGIELNYNGLRVASDRISVSGDQLLVDLQDLVLLSKLNANDIIEIIFKG